MLNNATKIDKNNLFIFMDFCVLIVDAKVKTKTSPCQELTGACLCVWGKAKR
jgi:hypothetical protein